MNPLNISKRSISKRVWWRSRWLQSVQCQNWMWDSHSTSQLVESNQTSHSTMKFARTNQTSHNLPDHPWKIRDVVSSSSDLLLYASSHQASEMHPIRFCFSLPTSLWRAGRSWLRNFSQLSNQSCDCFYLHLTDQVVFQRARLEWTA